MNASSILFVLWMVVLLKKVGMYLYAWQLKEYRFDRLINHFKEPLGSAIILTRNFYLKLAVLILLVPFLDAPNLLLPVLLLYGLEFILIVWRAVRGTLKLPVITLKSLTILLLSFFTPLLLFVLFAFDNLVGLVSYLLIIDVLTPVIVTAWVVVFKPITYGAKQLIVKRAIRKREQYKELTAIGITGSVGKTSTKEFLATLLSHRFRVTKTEAHQNTEMGSARALIDMENNTNVFIAEMAAYRKGDIKEISHVVKPTIGIITSIGPQHLGLFGSIETIIKTKFELADVLGKKQTLILNIDNPYIKQHIKRKSIKAQLLTYSLTNKKANFYASDIEEKQKYITFTVHHEEEKESFRVSVLGKHQVLNVLGAVAGAYTMGMTLKQISLRARKITPLARTMHAYQGIAHVTLINDTYNSSVQGIKAALEYLQLYRKRKRILIMPSLIELGNKARFYHEELGQDIANTCDYAFITDAKYKKELELGWKSVNPNVKNLHIHPDTQKLMNELKPYISEKSVFLLEGRVPREIIDLLSNY